MQSFINAIIQKYQLNTKRKIDKISCFSKRKYFQILKLKKNCIATHENQTFINIDLKMPNQKRKLIN